jgi:hypothetical protein
MAITRPVSFKNKEQKLIDFIGDRDFSYYIKGLIRADMEKIEIEKKPINKKRNVNFDI